MPVPSSIEKIRRSDVLGRIVERWQSKHTPDSIILYGHRRMGKTSIVQNLANYLPPHSLLVYLDLKGAIAVVDTMGDLLLALAEAIHAVAVKRNPTFPEPQAGDYQQAASADLHLKRILRSVIDPLPDSAFLALAFDEFEALEQAVNAGTLPVSVYDYLRTLSQQAKVTLLLAGLHTLDEMSRDYQKPFFNSYINENVSYLGPNDAERLIARPTPDFALNYEHSVINELYHLTHGQPLLLQSICAALVNHVNHELFDLELEREARILPTDLQAVLTDKFLLTESRYFEGIWNDQIAGFPDQRLVLRTLASQGSVLTAEALITQTQLSSIQVAQALQALSKRDVLKSENGQWSLLMPLFQRWLRLKNA